LPLVRWLPGGAAALLGLAPDHPMSRQSVNVPVRHSHFLLDDLGNAFVEA
jgi:hypothetical protein